MKVHQIVLLSILENPHEVFLLEGSAKFFEQHLLGSPIRLDQNLRIQQSSHTDTLFPRPTLQHIPSCSKRLATQTLFQLKIKRELIWIGGSRS
ncbi:hypothetical protein PVK06_025256 [Gossypium arboreum]|uniref:Uncharacterized protein n=1 Tax=Gossypium arboreum TaxID=29729 RepID=A0ABR0PGB2_GOSAR|nr:hypothetical protein PVK06_025256 [Gossypium arboreum]